jgi:hypothetical protein
MNKSLSDSDIKPYVKNIIVYSDLKHISARELLGMVPVAILYQITPNYGHWTLLLKSPEGIEFFDPYGYKPDKEFGFLDNQQPHYLAMRLLELSKIINIHYNQYKYQSKREGVNTCGRWVIVRAVLNNLTTEQFHDAILSGCKRNRLNPDPLVVMLTS